VLKQFFHVDKDAEVNMNNPGVSYVDPMQHKEKIADEAHCLAEGTWFLKDFFDNFKKTKLIVEIDQSTSL
jgi:hypothetical protein